MTEFDSVRMYWRRLSEVKPEIEGYYLTYCPTLRDEPRFRVNYWFQRTKCFMSYADKVSHWALLKVPRPRLIKEELANEKDRMGICVSEIDG